MRKFAIFSFVVFVLSVFPGKHLRAQAIDTIRVDTTSVNQTVVSFPQQMTNTDTLTIPDTTSIFIQDLEHFVEVGFHIAVAPLLFDHRDWMHAGVAALATAPLFLVDRDVKDWALRNRSELNDRLFNLDRYYGNRSIIFVSWGVYGFGALAGNDRLRTLGRNLTEAVIFSGAVTGGIKYLLGRRRPYAGKGNLFFRPVHFLGNDYESLPSGHTTLAFAFSTVMAHARQNILWKMFWYGSAGLVGASRVYHNQHWISDVVLGAFIGYHVGRFVVQFNRKTQGRIFSMRVQPYYSPNKVGILCVF
jgi:membrane-associated phospholipid phosphatase